MLTDIEIAQQAKMLPITKIGEQLGLTEDDWNCTGSTKRKSQQKRNNVLAQNRMVNWF